MTKLYDLHVILRLYHANLMNLHWNSIGEDFNDSHKAITSDYYDLCYKYIDITAEMLTRLGINPPNYVEVAQYMHNSDETFCIVDSQKMYRRIESIDLANTMFSGIVSLIEETLEEPEIQDNIHNAGIKSDLESMHSEFDLQLRYINRRRMG